MPPSRLARESRLSLRIRSWRFRGLRNSAGFLAWRPAASGLPIQQALNDLRWTVACSRVAPPYSRAAATACTVFPNTEFAVIVNEPGRGVESLRQGP